MSGWLRQRRGVSVENRDALEPEPGRDEFEQPLPDRCHANAVRTFACQRRHREWITIAAHLAKRGKVGSRVHNETKTGHSATDSNPNVDDAAAGRPNPGMVGVRGTFHTKGTQQIDSHQL